MSTTIPSGAAARASVNVAVVRGCISSPPEVRVLASRRRLAVLQVTTRREGEPATSVPVAVWDPPAWLDALDAGAEVVVVGRVRRRFFRAAAGAASRVEVEATWVGRGGTARRLETALRRARAALDELDG